MRSGAHHKIFFLRLRPQIRSWYNSERTPDKFWWFKSTQGGSEPIYELNLRSETWGWDPKQGLATTQKGPPISFNSPKKGSAYKTQTNLGSYSTPTRSYFLGIAPGWFEFCVWWALVIHEGSFGPREVGARVSKQPRKNPW